MLPAFIMQKRSVFYAKLGICHWRGCWKRIKRGGFCKQKQQQLQTFQLFQLIKQESVSSSRRPSSSSSSGSSSGNSGYSSSFKPSFDQNTDYQALINDAVSRGDYMSAAKYEQQRNAKINAGYGNGYGTTNYYTGYLNGSNFYGNNSSRNPHPNNRYINDYDNVASITMPFVDANGNRTTKRADMGVKLDIYDQMNNLEHDDLARAQYSHWRALATGVAQRTGTAAARAAKQLFRTERPARLLQ